VDLGAVVRLCASATRWAHHSGTSRFDADDHLTGYVVDLERDQSGQSNIFSASPIPSAIARGLLVLAVRQQSRCRGPWPQWWMLDQFSGLVNPHSFRKSQNSAEASVVGSDRTLHESTRLHGRGGLA
jgi:hypothetical protein